MAADLDVEFRLDETLTIDVAVKKLDGTAADISALTADDIKWGMAKTREAGGVLKAECTIGDGVEIVNGPQGLARIRLDKAAQDQLSPGKYFHECRVTTDEGESVQFEGTAEVKRSIYGVGA